MVLVWHGRLILRLWFVLRFEADDEEALERIQRDFRRVILAQKPDAKLPF